LIFFQATSFSRGTLKSSFDSFQEYFELCMDQARMKGEEETLIQLIRDLVVETEETMDEFQSERARMQKLSYFFC